MESLKTPGLLTKRLYSPFRKRMTKRLLSLRHVVRSPAKSRRQISKAKKEKGQHQTSFLHALIMLLIHAHCCNSSTKGEPLMPSPRDDPGGILVYALTFFQTFVLCTLFSFSLSPSFYSLYILTHTCISLNLSVSHLSHIIHIAMYII